MTKLVFIRQRAQAKGGGWKVFCKACMRMSQQEFFSDRDQAQGWVDHHVSTRGHRENVSKRKLAEIEFTNYFPDEPSMVRREGTP